MPGAVPKHKTFQNAPVMTSSPLPPGSTIGILGGGQLGRMLALAAARLGFKCHIYAPPGDNPAFDVASAHTAAAYDDKAALNRFAATVDVATYEFENVPLATAEIIAHHTRLQPSAMVLQITQDRLSEKTFLAGLGIDVPSFAPASNLDELTAAVAEIGRPCVLKTRRLGYDGKGQVMIRQDTDLAAAWQAIAEAPAIVEAFVEFRCEVSVIAARTTGGDMEVYDIPQNHHENHILKTSSVPAQISAPATANAHQIARKIGEALDYIGIFAVELFVIGNNEDEHLMVNEIAPRVHNSGHWTEAACVVSQFEQHIRAIAGWPLGNPARHSDAVMHNLLGEEISRSVELAAQSATLVHVYGKSQARQGRKMGHATHLRPRTQN